MLLHAWGSGTGFALALLLAAGCAAPRSPRASGATDLGGWLDAWHERRDFVGVVLVARGDEVLLAEGRGLADPGTGRRNDARTHFDLASIAKPFLAVVALRLAERGTLDLDAPIGACLPELTAAPVAAATLRQLLSHTSGLIDHSDVPGYFARARAGELDRAALLAIVRTAPLRFPPGTGFGYSNLGYTLVALAAERATGRSYPDLLADEVLVPLELADTTWNDVRCPDPRRAVGFERAFDGTLVRQAPVDALADLGSGDVLGSALDLWRFERALSSGGHLTSRSMDAMLHDPRLPAHDRGGTRGYGLGWEIYRTPWNGAVRETQGHGGLTYGFVTVMERDPGADTFFAILSNVRPSDDVLNNVPPPDIRRMQSDLRQLLWGRPVAAPRRCLAPTLLERTRRDGLDAALAEVRRLRAESRGAYELDPNAVMLAAYELDAVDDSIRLMRVALDEAPDSWLLHEALGDFLAQAGRVDEALDAYRTAQRARPERAYLRERIEALEVGR